MIDPTEEQKRIFQFIKEGKGNGIIDAVAGAGKTTTIMECANYIENKTTVLFCAFNNSIANEIEKKFHKLGLNEVTVKTIHALGRHILYSNNNTGNPITLENNKYKELLKSNEIQLKFEPHIAKIININRLDIQSSDSWQRSAINSLVNLINKNIYEINQKFRSTLTKNNLDDFEKMVIHFGIFNEIEVRKLNFKAELEEYYKCHNILLEAGNELSKRTMIIDFTDMLYLPYVWKLQSPKKYDFLFIDECQDLSLSQFAITTKYCKPEGRVLSVGDPSQSIYGFTGADINSFNIVKEWTKATPLFLTTCFRCPQKVIELARMIRIDITGSKSDSGVVDSIFFDDITEMAKPGDLIISRLRSPLVVLVFNFIDKNIKIQIHEDEVNEIINELKKLFKKNELSINISILPDEFYQLKDEVFNRWEWIIAKEAERITDTTERTLFIESEKKYLKTKLDFLHKKYELWKPTNNTVYKLLEKIKDYITDTDNPIKLSTIHRAKGLENERVFVLNYDELPYYRVQQKDWEKVQELNLKYVAITRSLKELYLVEKKKMGEIEEEGSLFDSLPF